MPEKLRTHANINPKFAQALQDHCETKLSICLYKKSFQDVEWEWHAV